MTLKCRFNGSLREPRPQRLLGIPAQEFGAPTHRLFSTDEPSRPVSTHGCRERFPVGALYYYTRTATLHVAFQQLTISAGQHQALPGVVQGAVQRDARERTREQMTQLVSTASASATTRIESASSTYLRLDLSMTLPMPEKPSALLT